MRRLFKLIFGRDDRLVVVESADWLGYRVERIPVVPDTPADLLYLIDGS